MRFAPYVGVEMGEERRERQKSIAELERLSASALRPRIECATERETERERKRDRRGKEEEEAGEKERSRLEWYRTKRDGAKCFTFFIFILFFYSRCSISGAGLLCGTGGQLNQLQNLDAH
jgi:hypothetical protein